MRTLLLTGTSLLAVLTGLVTRPAVAAVVQLASPASLSAADTTLQFPYSDSNRIFSSPVSFSAGGNTLTFTSTGSAGFELDQVGTTYGGTMFQNGTNLLSAGAYQGSSAPVTIRFATSVTEFGFNAEEYSSGAYTLSFTAFDGARPLGIFTSPGNDPSFLSFAGLQASGGDVITSVVVADNSSNNILFGPVTFGTPPVTPVTPVPEPATLALLGTGLLGLSLVARHRKVALHARGR